MIFPREFIEEIKERISASSIVRKRVVLKSKGNEHSGLCPFHSEKTPSFTVNDSKGFFHCFGCGAHGNIFDFVMRTEGLNFPETIEKLALEAGLKLPQADPHIVKKLEKEAKLVACAEAAAKFFKSQLVSSNGYAAREYLQSRAIKPQTIEEFGLGFAPDVPNALKSALLAQGYTETEMAEIGLIKNNYEMFRGRLIFPISNSKGRVIAFGGRILANGEPKYLNSPETSIFHKRRILYGKSVARKFIHESGQVIVCEGYLDVISLNQSGFKNAVAPLGTSLTEEHLAELWAMAPEPTLCFDGDNAGAKAANRAANLALPHLLPGKSLKICILPKGKDPDDIVKENPELLQALVASAKPLSEFVYEAEKLLKSTTTPEQVADFKARLEAKATEIKNPDISKNYQDYFKNRFWQEFKQQAQPVVKARLSANIVQMTTTKPESQKIEQIQLYMLGCILHSPELLENSSIEEELANFEFSNLEIDKLRQNILNIQPLDEFAIAQILKNLNGNLANNLKRGMEFCKKQIPADAWNQLKDSYYLEIGYKELNENDECDEEEFYKLQELVNNKLRINQKNND